ncbi:hypothetical protein BDZ91DRAFT_737013, partial [Kalaharituber pfeilii]
MYERGARLTFLQHFLAIIANLALASLRDRSRPMFRLRGDRVGRGHLRCRVGIWDAEG